MWIRPNWDGADGQVHSLFSARVKPGNYLNLNKLADGRLGVATGGAGEGGTCGSGRTTCSAVQTESNPASSAASATRMAASESAQAPMLMP